MPTLPSEQHRDVAEGFGADADRYQRARPTYPLALIDRIDAEARGRRLLDIGVGTGISSRPFLDCGYQTLGVEPDDRMAALARQSGLDVETARFEDWDPAGRTFDVAVAAMAWHWVDTVQGAARLAEILTPGGLFVAFWNAMQLPEDLTTAFAEVYDELAPQAPMAGFLRQRKPTADVYTAGFPRVEDALRDTGAFEPAVRWRDDWQRDYTADEWLDLAPTIGGHHLLPPDTLTHVLERMREILDGRTFTMSYATVAVAARCSPR